MPVLVIVLTWSTGSFVFEPVTAKAADPSGCRPVARVVSIQGEIQIRRAGESDWRYVRRLDSTVCEGDLLLTGTSGRAALLLSPETLFRVQQNSTVAIRQTRDETVVEYTISDRAPVGVVPSPCGGGYFITRFPKKFRVLTPFINASVEGTEFLVALSCQSATVAVLEGRVLAQELLAANSTAFSLEEGQQITAGGAEAPAVKLLVKPVDAVQWALYYPPLTAPAGEDAADQVCDQADDVERGQCLLQRAEQRLRLGRVEEAEADLEALSAIAPTSGEPYALRSIIRLTKNDKAEALALAQRATDLSPESSRAWLALSYGYQAAFDLDKALEAAQKSAALDSTSSIAQARVAELLMSLGRIREAEKAARAAVVANANDSRAHTVLGFVHLAQIDTKAAREDFLAAIERDSADPLPRLGLGLAIIRDGDLQAGREQIEIAVVLDPTNSLIRSYVGKAYYEESTKERDELAAKQFAIAKELDPKDPTPWFYDAILKQAQNRPVEALDELQASLQRNDDRAVFRSKLLLDQDRAARSANLARVYDSLGFEQLAFTEAVKALTDDPGNYSAHRFLAETYGERPRHEIARESEFLQSALRQPVSVVPPSALRPLESLQFPRAGLPRIVGSSKPSLNEFDRLFDRNGFGLFADALAGSDDTVGLQTAVYGLHDRVFVSVGYGHVETNAFGEGREFFENAGNAFVQADLSDRGSVQFELQQSKVKRGDFFSSFDPSFTDPIRLVEDIQRARLGARVDISSGSHLIVSGTYQRLETDLELLLIDGTSLFDSQAGTAELQYSYSDTRFSAIVGGGHLDGKTERNSYVSDVFIESRTTQSYYNNAYLYGQYHHSRSGLKLQLGLSRDLLQQGDLRSDSTNPKVGLLWSPTAATTLRAAAFKSMKRQFVGNRTIEPTQVAGFNQFFDDSNGTLARRYGIGADQRLAKTLHFGFEATKRDLEVPLFAGDSIKRFEWQEKTARAYAYWWILPQSARHPSGRWSWALTAEYRDEFFERPEDFTGNEGIVDLRTRYVPLGLNVFPKHGVAVRLLGTHVSQTGRLRVDPFADEFEVDESFWIADISASYRIPRRLGLITVGVSNVFDKQFAFQETDTANPQFVLGRFFFARITLQF